MNTIPGQENFLWRWFSKIGDFLGLSLIWLLLCIPVLTIAPASISLYDAIVHCVHGDEEGTIRRFFSTFRKELLRGLGLSVLWLVIFGALGCGYWIFFSMGAQNEGKDFYDLYSLVYLGTMLIPLGILTWVTPVQARFKHSFLSLHKTAAIYAITHLPTTLLLWVIILIAAALVYFLSPVLLVLLPGIVVTVQSWLIEKVFKKYIIEEEPKEVSNGQF